MISKVVVCIYENYNTLLCARFGDGVGGLSLENIAKDWLGFLPLLRRVSQDTSCVLVHGYSSCDLGLLQ